MGNWVYRGEASTSWRSLMPALERLLGPNVVYPSTLLYEVAAIAEFRYAAASHLDTLQTALCENVLDSWMLMQHFRCPTRLLDWTSSPWVAAYFASADPQLAQEDAYIWAFDRTALEKGGRREFPQLNELSELIEFSHGPLNELWLVRPRRAIPRVLSQQSLFTVARRLRSNHAELLASQIPDDRRFRILIKSWMKQELMQRLHSMNLTGSTLFPGLEGVGIHVAEILTIGRRLNVPKSLLELSQQLGLSAPSFKVP
jgi:hypothetical protein